jgi:hypothetical protein
MQNVWAGRSELLHEAIGRSLDAIEFSHGQLMREQVEASDPAAYEPAALACLAAAEAAGGTARAALPGAVSIALMSQMALVFMGLENSGGVASLSTAWGMPRSLNAGDAMFAVAQDSLLAAVDELTAEERLQATRILDGGARTMVDALFDAPEGDVASVSQRALLPAAMALGGLLGGANPKTRERLRSLGQAWATLPADELSRRLAGDPRSWLAT